MVRSTERFAMERMATRGFGARKSRPRWACHDNNQAKMRHFFTKPLTFSAVSLDDAVINPWVQTTRYGRVDFAEVCCASGSLLSGAVTSVGGRAVQYSHWNGSEVTTKARTDKLKQYLLEKRPRVVWMTLPCTTQLTQQSLSRS